MKFPMFKKETTDKNYHEDPFRAVNFKIDGDGKMRCPNGKGFHLQYRKAIKGNAYGREEEIYQCEDCSGCPYAEKCKKGRFLIGPAAFSLCHSIFSPILKQVYA